MDEKLTEEMRDLIKATEAQRAGLPRPAASARGFTSWGRRLRD